MALTINVSEGKNRKMYTVKDRVFVTADESEVVPEGDPRAAFLLATPGKKIPLEQAQSLGLTGTAPVAKDDPPVDSPSEEEPTPEEPTEPETPTEEVADIEKIEDAKVLKEIAEQEGVDVSKYATADATRKAIQEHRDKMALPEGNK